LTQTPDPAAAWGRVVKPVTEFPWNITEDPKPADEELKRRDAWARVFSPIGAVVAARTDDRHWLCAGCSPEMPVLFGGGAVLLTPVGVQAPVRLGIFQDAPPEPPAAAADPAKKDEKPTPPPPPGWTLAPKDKELSLRMSGLLWPEAAARIANSAYVTQERIGKGQVILFASNPAKRAATLGTERILSNAIVYGPGLGASQAIRP
ncbi:MAG: peptidase, partial [Phycisphaerales bacterium]